MVCVDWCDAYAYCKGVGKRMCGKIGGGANGYSPEYANDASKSQWYNACSSGGVNQYPYGDSYVGSSCNGGGFEDPHVGTMAVGSMTGCQSSVSGYEGVYDLSGNVYEWEDSCSGNTGPTDRCRLRGGSNMSPSDSLDCGDPDVTYHTRDNVVYDSFGFRCCAP